MDENDKIIRDNLLGYLSYSVLDEDDTTAYIKMIEIKKTERRKGIGTKLINSLEKEYKNIQEKEQTYCCSFLSILLTKSNICPKISLQKSK